MRKIDLTNFQVATSETARQINRRIALNFIRRHQPVARAGVDARFVRQTSWPTPAEPARFVSELARTVAAFRAADPQMLCEGLGVSLPGRVDAAGNLIFAPNLGWAPINLCELIENAVELPVVAENAANACA